MLHEGASASVEENSPSGFLTWIAQSGHISSQSLHDVHFSGCERYGRPLASSSNASKGQKCRQMPQRLQRSVEKMGLPTRRACLATLTWLLYINDRTHRVVAGRTATPAADHEMAAGVAQPVVPSDSHS
jgi:hypothetical protein